LLWGGERVGWREGVVVCSVVRIMLIVRVGGGGGGHLLKVYSGMYDYQ